MTRKANLDSWISSGPNSKGYYEAKVWMGTKADGSPDRRHVQRKALKDVRARVKELEAQRDAGVIRKAGKAPTVREMLERHLDVILPSRGRAPRTINDYRSKCRNDIFPLWGGQRIDRLLPEHIEEGLAEMLAEGHAKSHVRKVLAILSSAYEVQVKRGNVARNPCAHVEPPELAEPEIVALTHEEAVAILEVAAGRRNGDRWVVALSYGLRQGEALGMRWKYLDLETGRLDIWFQLQRLTWRHGCGEQVKRSMRARGVSDGDIAEAIVRAEQECARKHCKTKPCPKRCSRHTRACPPPCPAGCRDHARKCPERKDGGRVFREIKEKRRKTIWLDDDLTELLRRHRERQMFERLTADHEWEENDLVFCQWNGRPVEPRWDWGEWQSILEAAGLPRQRVHVLRHSAATFLVGEGVALPVVQKILGHSDSRITERYVHVAEAQMKEAASRIGRRLRIDRTAPKTVPTRDEERS